MKALYCCAFSHSTNCSTIAYHCFITCCTVIGASLSEPHLGLYSGWAVMIYIHVHVYYRMTIISLSYMHVSLFQRSFEISFPHARIVSEHSRVFSQLLWLSPACLLHAMHRKSILAVVEASLPEGLLNTIQLSQTILLACSIRTWSNSKHVHFAK